jgi:hypothetical protein
VKPSDIDRHGGLDAAARLRAGSQKWGRVAKALNLQLE